jgi:TP901 family phage tail tape measure protein
MPQLAMQWLHQGLNGFLSDLDNGINRVNAAGDAASGPATLGMNILNGAVIGLSAAITTKLIEAATGAVNALVGLGTESVGMAADFQSQVIGLQAAGARSARELGLPLEALGDIAMDVGDDTRLMGVSAVGAADAMTKLLRNGLDLTTVMGDVNGYMNDGAELGGALRASIDTAAATELDMVQASELAVISLNLFGRELETGAEKAEFVEAAMNNYVQTAGAGVVTVSDLQAAMTNIGPVAADYGFQLEDVNVALGILADRGIRGSQAGTALRSMFTNLGRPTKAVTEALDQYGISLYDSEEQMYSLVEIMGQLEIATNSMTQEQRNQFIQTVAGTYGMRAMTSLLSEGVDGYYEYAAAVGQSQTIQERAAAQSESYSARMEALSGNIETLKIRIGTALLPILSEMIGVFSIIVDRYGPVLVRLFEEIGEAVQPFSKYLREALDSGEPFNEFLADIPTWAQPAAAKLGEVIGFAGELGRAISDFFWMIDANIDPLAALRIALITAFGPEAGGVVDRFTETLQRVREWIGRVREKIEEIAEKVRPVIDDIRDWITENVELKDILLAIGGSLATLIVPAIAVFALALLKVVGSVMFVIAIAKALRQAWEDNLFGIQDKAREVWGWIQTNVPEIVETVREKATEAIQTIREWWDEHGAGIIETITNLIEKMGGIKEIVMTIAKVLVASGLIVLISAVIAKIMGVIGVIVSLLPLVGMLAPIMAKVAAVFGLVGLAVQQTIKHWDKIKAAISPVIAAIGSAINMMVSLLPFFSELGPGLSESFASIKESFGALGVVLGELWTALQPIIQILGGVLIVVIGLVVGALAGLTVGVAALVDGFAKALAPIIDMVTGFAQVLTGAFNIIIGLFDALITGSTERITTGIAQGQEGNKALWRGLWEAVEAIVVGALNAVVGTVVTFVASVIAFFTTLVRTLVGNSIIPDMVNAILMWFGTLVTGAVAFVTDLVAKVIAFFTNLFNSAVALVSDLVNTVIEWFSNLYSQATEKVSEMVASIIEKFSELLADGVAKAKELATTVIEKVTELATEGVKLITGFVRDFLEKLSELPGEVGKIIRDAVETVEGFVGDFRSAAGDIVGGLIGGIKAKAAEVANAVKGLIRGAIGAGNSELQAESPSKVFTNLGETIPQGLAVGIDQGEKTAISSMQHVMGAIMGVADQGMHNVGQLMMGSLTDELGTSINVGRNALRSNVMAAQSSMMAPSVYVPGSGGAVDNSRHISVEVNATYANQQSEASIYYDVAAALAGARL